MRKYQLPLHDIQARKRFLEAGFRMAEMPCLEEALGFGLEVLCSNAFAMVGLIVTKGSKSNSADCIFQTDYFLCTEICIDSIEKLIDANPNLINRDNYEAWKRLTVAFQHVRFGEINGWSLVCSLFLLACAVYLIDRKLGRPFLPESHFPESYLSLLRSLYPPVLFKPESVNQDLMNCIMHLENQLKPEAK